MNASESDAKALGDLRASLQAKFEEGATSTAMAISRIGRGCGPYFGQGLRRTFVNLGIVHNVKLMTRKREAESAMTLDRIAHSSSMRVSCKLGLCALLLASVVWGAGNVMASVRTNGGSAASASAPLKMDPVASLEIQDAAERILTTYRSDRSEFASLVSSLNPQARNFCVALLGSFNSRETPRIQASFPGSDSSFREARVQFTGKRPVHFMFRKDPGMTKVQFLGLRPDVR